MPYRIDIPDGPDDVLERLVELGALDVESVGDGIAAIIPDVVAPQEVARALGVPKVAVSSAIARDDESVWLLTLRPLRIGGAALRMTDSVAFGSGRHPTTALCIEAIQQAVEFASPNSILDVGTGSGVLALAALMMGVTRAVGIDIDPEALKVAAENARINKMKRRLRLAVGGPEIVSGSWPLVVANVLAAPLIEMAPILVRRVASSGGLILSGITPSLESEVRHAYEHVGMHHIRSESRSGWTALIFQSSW